MTKHGSSPIVYGFHAVTARIRQSPGTIRMVYLDKRKHDARVRKLEALARGQDLHIEFTGKDEIGRLTGEVAHQGVVAVIDETPLPHNKNLDSALQECTGDELILVLDGIQDPANLGACLRAADGAGVKLVILTRDKSSPVTPVTRKVAAGAAEALEIHTVTNLARTLALLKRHAFWVLGLADDSADSLFGQDFSGRTAMVLGNEGRGLRRLTREHCDRLLSIPMSGSVESLNVSVAAGIAMFEIRRQRMHRQGAGLSRRAP